MSPQKVALPPLLVLLTCALAAPAAGQSPPREGAPTPEVETQNPVEECDEFMEAYLQSASRKLYRSLQGHGFTLEQISLQPWMDLQVTVDGETRAANFSLIQEKNGKVAALLDSEHQVRRTWVVAHTEAGALMTRFTWPAPDAIDSLEDCRPIRSSIAHPEAPLSRIVDVEPFKFWGLRVLWRLPADFKPGAADHDAGRSLFQVVKDTVGTSN